MVTECNMFFRSKSIFLDQHYKNSRFERLTCLQHQPSISCWGSSWSTFSWWRHIESSGFAIELLMLEILHKLKVKLNQRRERKTQRLTGTHRHAHENICIYTNTHIKHAVDVMYTGYTSKGVSTYLFSRRSQAVMQYTGLFWLAFVCWWMMNELFGRMQNILYIFTIVWNVQKMRQKLGLVNTKQLYIFETATHICHIENEMGKDTVRGIFISFLLVKPQLITV